MADNGSGPGGESDEHEMPRRRPWGPASYRRLALVVLAVFILVLIAMRAGLFG
jgi:hypothetical protein